MRRTPRRVHPGVVALALLGCSAPLWAQSALKTGFDAAWARQPEQRAAALRRDAAAAAQRAAQRWTPEPPSLELSGKTDRLNRNDGVRELDTTLAVPLWLPGERGRAQAVAVAQSAAVDARQLHAQWRLAAELRDSGWAHRRARIEHDLAAQRLAHARQIAADVARRVKAGDLARADGHQAEAAVAAAESALAQAAVEMTQSALAWTALTGQAAPEAIAAEPRPADDAQNTAHPLLRELATRADVARSRRDLASTQRLANPELTVGSVRERDGFGSPHGQSIVVGVRIPLGNSSASQERIATAGADLLEAQTQLELEGRRMQAQAEAARARLKSLEAAHAAAERRAQLARESRGYFEKSFRLGESDLPTRLRVELEAFEAERQAQRSRVEVDAAVSHLRQALGLLPE